MNEAILMNRFETKYVISVRKLPELLARLSGSYYILEINNIRSLPYKTIYLDTSDLLFYMQQIRGKLERDKVRYRIYESTGLSFLEIKKKTNKNKTIKWRIENSLQSDSPDGNASAFIKEYLHYNCSGLRPVLINGFTRITLVGRELNERITMDFNINFSSPCGKNCKLPFLAIVELKREKYSGQASTRNIMKQIGFKPSGFSKYCIGSALINDIPRKNRLKPNLLLINKIENEYINSHDV